LMLWWRIYRNFSIWIKYSSIPL